MNEATTTLTRAAREAGKRGGYVPGSIGEVVVNTLPKKRTRAELHHLPGYYDLRNHVVDFLIKRAKPGEAH